MIKRCIATLLTLVLCMVPTGGLLLPARVAEQPPRDFANLVLFAYFSDEPNKDYFNQPSAQPGKSRAQALMELYDGQQAQTGSIDAKRALSNVGKGSFAGLSLIHI